MPFPVSVSMSARLATGLLSLAFVACSKANPPTAPAATPVDAAAPSAGAAVFGNWSRTPEGCKRPEFKLGASDVTIQTDGDGTLVAFDYRKVAWAADAQGQPTVELNKAHPYGKAPSKTALSFKVMGVDDIELVQRTHPAALHRCPAP